MPVLCGKSGTWPVQQAAVAELKAKTRMQDQDQDRTGSYLQEAVSPYRLLGAKHGPPTPGPPRIALELPQRQSAVPQQPDNHPAQTSPDSPATIAFPFHQSTLNISPPKPSRPTPTRSSCGNPKPARPRPGGHTAQAAPLLQSPVARQSLPHTHSHSLTQPFLHPVTSLAHPPHWQLQPSWLIHVCPSCYVPTSPPSPPASLLGTSPMQQPCIRVPAYLWTLE